MIDHPDFRRAMQDAGLVPPPRLIADGNPHRCTGGLYAISRDGRWGAYRDGRSGWLGWSALEASEQATALRRQERAKLAADEKIGRERARLKAVEMWGKAV